MANHSVLFSFKLDKIKENNGYKYSTWMETSLIYRIFMALDRFCRRIEAKLYDHIKKSVIFGPIVNCIKREKKKSPLLENSLLYKGLSRYSWSNILIFIPTAFVVVDYIIRRVSFLSRFGSIWDELLLIIIFGYILISRIFSGGKIKYNFTPMDLPVIIYIILGICHVFIKSPELGVAIEGFRSVYQHILWYFIATQLIRTREDSEKVINLMMLIGLFLGLHSLYQYIMKVPMPGNWVDVNENITTRAFSIIGSPNILGVIFVLFIPIGVSMMFAAKDRNKRIFYFATVGFMTIGLLLTMSRGAWLAFAFGMLIYILALLPKLIFPFMGLGGAFILFGGSLSERLLYMLTPTYMMKSSKGGRLYRWAAGIRIWQRDKIFGLGLGRYGGAVAMNNNLAPFYLDNYYLKTLSEMGLYGIGGLLFVIVSFVISSIKIIRSQGNLKDRIITVGLFSGCVGVLTQNFVENIFEVPAMIIYFWIVVALINTFAPKYDSH